jgi:nucleoside-diphosphate-sugar epimerase
MCLVTGGSGLIGRFAVNLLREAGAKVKTASLDDLRLWEDVENYHMDLRVAENGRTILDLCQPEYVFHLAGLKSGPVVTKTKPLSFFLPMAQLNLSFLGACAEARVQRLVYSSSVGAYGKGAMTEAQWAGCGRPQDGYPGWAKRIGEFVAEAALLERGLSWATLRLSNTYGPGDDFDPETAMVVPALMAKALRGDDPVVVLGNGSARRDFLWAGCAARAVMMAGLDTEGWRRVNVGGGIGTTIHKLAYHLGEVTGAQFVFAENADLRPEGTRILPIFKAKDLGWVPEVGLLDGLRLALGRF